MRLIVLPPQSTFFSLSFFPTSFSDKGWSSSRERATASTRHTPTAAMDCVHVTRRKNMRVHACAPCEPRARCQATFPCGQSGHPGHVSHAVALRLATASPTQHLSRAQHVAWLTTVGQRRLTLGSSKTATSHACCTRCVPRHAWPASGSRHTCIHFCAQQQDTCTTPQGNACRLPRTIYRIADGLASHSPVPALACLGLSLLATHHTRGVCGCVAALRASTIRTCCLPRQALVKTRHARLAL